MKLKVVSIPNRDFVELQFKALMKEVIKELKVVSIPNRDFVELQWRKPESQAVFSFQGTVARI